MSLDSDKIIVQQFFAERIPVITILWHRTVAHSFLILHHKLCYAEFIFDLLSWSRVGTIIQVLDFCGVGLATFPTYSFIWPYFLHFPPYSISKFSTRLFGPILLWNWLKITTLLVYLALLVYVAPENILKNHKNSVR